MKMNLPPKRENQDGGDSYRRDSMLTYEMTWRINCLPLEILHNVSVEEV